MLIIVFVKSLNIMGIVIGIDVGISTTKIVGIREAMLFRLYVSRQQTLLLLYMAHSESICMTIRYNFLMWSMLCLQVLAAHI